MTITLTLEKNEKIWNLCQEIIREDAVTVRFLSKLIGNLVATFPAVILRLFYYRQGQGKGTTTVQWKLWCLR